MRETKRQQIILDYLREHNEGTVEELSAMLFVSPATMRRDLEELQQKGLVKRTHGGAIFQESLTETSVRIRRKENENLKRLLVPAVLQNLPEFSTVFIDNSSTCFLLAERINFTHKTIVTNGLDVAMYLASKNDVTTILSGGFVSKSTASTSGSITLELIQKIRFDLCLVSCAAFDEKYTYEKSLASAEIKKLALWNSAKRILVADKAKFRAPGAFATEKISAYDLVVTNDDFAIVDGLHGAGVKLCTV